MSVLYVLPKIWKHPKIDIFTICEGKYETRNLINISSLCVKLHTRKRNGFVNSNTKNVDCELMSLCPLKHFVINCTPQNSDRVDVATRDAAERVVSCNMVNSLGWR